MSEDEVEWLDRAEGETERLTEAPYTGNGGEATDVAPKDMPEDEAEWLDRAEGETE